MKRVLLVQADRINQFHMEAGLPEAGYVLLEQVTFSPTLKERLALLHPDVVVIEAQTPEPELLEILAALESTWPCPVVLFVHHATDSEVAAAMQLGVIVHAVEMLTPLLLHSLIDVACLYYSSQKLLVSELEHVQQTLADHRHIEQAKCLLMEKQHLSEKEAYALLRRQSMDRSQRLATVARAILAAHEREVSRLGEPATKCG